MARLQLQFIHERLYWFPHWRFHTCLDIWCILTYSTALRTKLNSSSVLDLPSDFLSTPFGAALRPTIDNMYRRPVPGAAPTPATIQPTPQAAQAAMAASPNPDLAATLLQAVASQAMSNGMGSSSSSYGANGSSTPSTQTLASPIHICTNTASFHNILKTHKAVIAFFTSATCGPCRMIEPTFEQLAHERTRAGDTGGGSGVAFVKVDLGVGMSRTVGAEYSVRVTPTFIFFRDGSKASLCHLLLPMAYADNLYLMQTHEMKGADRGEFTSQIDLLLWEAFPRMFNKFNYPLTTPLTFVLQHTLTPKYPSPPWTRSPQILSFSSRSLLSTPSHPNSARS